MHLMMTFITLAFIIRSSSLAPWIFLSAAKLIDYPSMFPAIVQATLTVTLPICLVCVLLDSLFYGKLTIPQLNFVHINVFQNLSRYFGIDPWYFYIQGLKHEFGTDFILTLFGLSLLTVRQMSGSLGPQLSKMPIFLIYIAVYLYMLSKVEHKERRFYAPIIQLAVLFQAYGLYYFWELVRNINEK